MHISLKAEVQSLCTDTFVFKGGEPAEKIFVVTAVKIGRVLAHKAEADIIYGQNLRKTA